MNPIYNSIKTIKYLEIDLTKEVKDLYTENYKRLMKECQLYLKSKTNKKTYLYLFIWKKGCRS